MTRLPDVDGRYMMERTADLCRIPSPTGFTAAAVAEVERELTDLGLAVIRTVKGSLVATFPEAADRRHGGRVLSAHVDTLGLMVKEIKANGRLRVSRIGGYDWSTVEGEYCSVHARGAAMISGTVVTTKASFHVHGEALATLKRDEQSIEIRLDAMTRSADDTRALGVSVGDYVSLDPRTTILESGFIKSRHLDDKACVAILMGVARALRDGGSTPAAPSHLYISTYGTSCRRAAAASAISGA